MHAMFHMLAAESYFVNNCEYSFIKLMKDLSAVMYVQQSVHEMITYVYGDMRYVYVFDRCICNLYKCGHFFDVYNTDVHCYSIANYSIHLLAAMSK